MDSPDGGSPALASLRLASAAVAQLAPPDGTDSADAPAGASADHDFDAAEHAARFEELHEALAAVLDELDRD